MIVSTPVLPRYKIGDLIRAFRAPYFRLDRFSTGKLPNCIEACPVRALAASPLGDLEEK